MSRLTLCDYKEFAKNHDIVVSSVKKTPTKQDYIKAVSCWIVNANAFIKFFHKSCKTGDIESLNKAINSIYFNKTYVFNDMYLYTKFLEKKTTSISCYSCLSYSSNFITINYFLNLGYKVPQLFLANMCASEIPHTDLVAYKSVIKRIVKESDEFCEIFMYCPTAFKCALKVNYNDKFRMSYGGTILKYITCDNFSTNSINFLKIYLQSQKANVFSNSISAYKLCKDEKMKLLMKEHALSKIFCVKCVLYKCLGLCDPYFMSYVFSRIFSIYLYL